MSTVTVCELLDPGDDVLGLVVDELVDAVTLDKLPLVVARVDSNDSVSSCDGVLASEMAETSSSSGNNNDVSWVSSDVLNCFVDGDSSTKDRCGSIQRETVRDLRQVVGVRDTPLLERSIDAKSMVLGFLAIGLLGPSAVLTGQATVG